MIYKSIIDCIGKTPIVSLGRLFPDNQLEVLAKLELLNPAGSVKDRPARFIIEEGLKSGAIGPETHLIESTSGNFGIALAMVARIYGLRFTAVVDPYIAATNLRMLRHYGARIEMVHQRDDGGGYLKSRLQHVEKLLHMLPHSLWINQYANACNWQAHFESTGQEILADVDGTIDYLVIAVSTTGTIHGIARALRERHPALKVVAVDAVGSVIFGAKPQPRFLPGIGSSRVPELLTPSEIDEVIYVSDQESIQGCHDLIAHEAIFAGGSSGSVVAAIQKLVPRIPRPARILTLFADRGERYLDLIYHDHPTNTADPEACSPAQRAEIERPLSINS